MFNEKGLEARYHLEASDLPSYLENRSMSAYTNSRQNRQTSNRQAALAPVKMRVAGSAARPGEPIPPRQQPPVKADWEGSLWDLLRARLDYSAKSARDVLVWVKEKGSADGCPSIEPRDVARVNRLFGVKVLPPIADPAEVGTRPLPSPPVFHASKADRLWAVTHITDEDMSRMGAVG